MNSGSLRWQPESSSSWAQLLGMIHVPLFGLAGSPRLRGDHAILLDGPKISFAFFASEDRDERLDTRDELLSWSWSAHVRHALILDPGVDRMFLRRWDSPSLVRQFRIPQRGLGAEELLALLERAPTPRTPDVVQHVLHGFRLIRQAVPGDSALEAIRLLNGFLLAVKAIRSGEQEQDAFLRARTFGEVIDNVPESDRRMAALNELAGTTRDHETGLLTHFFIDPEPRSGCRLYSDLLFRHAASQLYQEAHLQVERDPQAYIPGLGPTGMPRGRLSKDVRYTPANMARALVQEALNALDLEAADSQPLVALDPACGSGIFLRECLRELAARQFSGKATLCGYDTSGIATYITRFCLANAKADLPQGALELRFDIEQADALVINWAESDLVLMNPPFVSWQGMPGSQQELVRECLDDLFSGRPDLSLAFMRKGVDALRPGGVLATVLPAAQLDSTSGRLLREYVSEQADIVLLGRFKGYRYFPDSLVEPSFVVLRRKVPSHRARRQVKIVVAQEGEEDRALRSLRLSPVVQQMKSETVDVFSTDAGTIHAESWLPQRAPEHRFRAFLEGLALPTVGELFNVRQGALTGDNRAFVLSRQKMEEIVPPSERRYFRPAAGQGAIESARLSPRFYVFYPYGSSGLLLLSEEDLRAKVPEFYEGWLEARKLQLEGRSGARVWWALTRPRKWQHESVCKLVSTYFGGVGSFGYDRTGEYVVVHGYAWLWRARMAPKQTRDRQAYLDHTDVPWAYVALLNSSLFERILACYCPRVQGGQFNLSIRFVKRVPIPDLSDPQAVRPEMLSDLAGLGRDLDKAALEDVRGELNRVSARAYGLPEDV